MSSPLTRTLLLPLSYILVVVISSSTHQVTSQTTAALYSPIKKDESTNMYTMLIYLKTPLQPSQLHLDLGSYLPWYDCARHYKSSSYKPVIYNSSLCLDLDTKQYGNCFDKPGPGCSNDTCSFDPENPVTGKSSLGLLLTDKFALPTVKNRAQQGPVSDIVLSCSSVNKNANTGIYRGLAKGSKGVASLGRFNYSLSAQISRVSSNSPRIFALCLPSSSNSTGIVLFNSAGPYGFSRPEIDVSKFLVYTPLILGPQGTDIFNWYKSPDYYIGLTSFRVNGRVVLLNQTLLNITELGRGGTKLSTSRPYSVLQSSIFRALRDAFVKESAALNLTIVKPVEPFGVCYAADEIKMTPVGPGVPAIDLVMGKSEVFWRIYGWNSMVRIKSGDGVDGWCLGFVDGGIEPRTSIVIGGHQIEDTLLQFDLDHERVGFSSSLLLRSTTCANFNFEN